MRTFWLKITLSFLVAIYLFSTVGISFISHYCGGELQEVSVFVAHNDCCGDEEPEDNGCCQNETEHVALFPDVIYATNDISIKQPVSDLFIFAFGFVTELIHPESITTISLFYDIPPPDLLQECLISSTVLII